MIIVVVVVIIILINNNKGDYGLRNDRWWQLIGTRVGERGEFKSLS